MATMDSLRGSGCRGRHGPACLKRASPLEAGLRFPAWPMLPADRGRTGWIWQPRKDSNLRMPESESGALPLGDRKRGVEGKRVAVRVETSGGSRIKKKQ